MIAPPLDTLSARTEGSGVVRVDGAVQKSFAEDFTSEHLKHQLVEEALTAAGFVFPSLLSHDSDNRTLVMQDLGAITSLREDYLRAVIDDAALVPGAAATMREAGRALAVIHRIPLEKVGRAPGHPGFAETPMPEDDLGQRAVLLHGDYGFANVFRTADGDKIAVLDASPNYFMTSHALELGTAYVDLANFTSCLLGLVPRRQLLKIKWDRVAPLITGFVAGYEEASGQSIDRATLLTAARETARAYFRYKYTNPILRVLANTWFKTRVSKVMKSQ